jgi:NitT/TauT family transport system permease protein
VNASRRTVVSAAAVAVFLAAWELAPRAGLVDDRFTGRPSRVAAAGVEIVTDPSFPRHAATSVGELGSGMALAAVVAVPLGLATGTSRTLGHLLSPLIMALDASPRLALLPVLVVWLGIGFASKVAVVLASAAIPIVVNTMAGVRQVDASWAIAARSFGASPLDVFRKVLLPGSLPGIMTGVRLGLGRGILGVVVGEMYVSQAGVGNLIMQFGSSFRVDHLLFCTLLVSGFGYALTDAARRLEERLRA